MQKLIQGDCLEIMPTLDAMSFDLVVTDPPYQLNTRSAVQGKINPWADLCNSAVWYSRLFCEYKRLLKPEGAIWQFLNWRTLPTIQKAAFDADWQIESLLVWDKEWIGPGGPRGLRPSYEMVALLCCEDFGIDDRGIYDIRRCKWSGIKPTGHPAEKPEALFRWLIEISVSKPARILDPFAGSGTAGVAARQLGHEFVGIEIDPKWCELAQKRISQPMTKRMFE